MKKFAMLCAAICLGAPLQAATISGVEFNATAVDFGAPQVEAGTGTALSDTTACDTSTGNGCDLQLAGIGIDFIDDDSFTVGFQDTDRTTQNDSRLFVSLTNLDFVDGSNSVYITGVRFNGLGTASFGTPSMNFGENSVTLDIIGISDEDFQAGQTLQFDIITATIAPVPLPASSGLLGLGVLGFLFFRRRKTTSS